MTAQTNRSPSSEASSKSMAKINVENLSKRYPGADEYAISDVDFAVQEEEIFMLLGPSGSGKTTTMNIIAGFIEPTEGAVELDGSPVEGPSPDKGVIFQGTDSSIFPWLTTKENVEFGLKMNGTGKEKRSDIAEEALATVGLLSAKDKFPRELSGGMKQRVQMARSLAVDPEVLLADEPFASLDAQTKKVLQDELLDVWEASKKTIVFVTHDIDEAVKLGNRIAVFSEGPNANLTEVVDVPMDYPRDNTSEQFADMVTRIERLLGVEPQ